MDVQGSAAAGPVWLWLANHLRLVIALTFFASVLLAVFTAWRLISLAQEQRMARLVLAGRGAVAAPVLRRLAASPLAMSSTHYLYGKALAETGDLAGAARELQLAVAKAGGLPDVAARYELGTVLFREGRVIDGRAQLLIALGYFGEYARDLLQLGDDLWRDGQVAAARAAWEIVVARGLSPWAGAAEERLRRHPP